MLKLTLDTSTVIHAAQAQPYGPEVDELVELARQGRVGLWITTAFGNDQERAPADKHQRNLAWLADRPLIGTVPGGFRLDYSQLGIDTVLLGTEQKAAAEAIDETLLPKAYRAGKLRADDEAVMARWRRKANDVQHLVAHLIAGHDAFVTSDDDDMLKKRAELRARTGIVVVDPAEAVQMARGQAARDRAAPGAGSSPR
jgi:hypothetical protein